MNATLAYIHALKDQIERASVPAQRKPWPVSSKPDFANGVLLSDGTIQTFRSYGRAMSFIERNPAPSAREQIEGSLFAERVERDTYYFEEETADRDRQERD